MPQFAFAVPLHLLMISFSESNMSIYSSGVKKSISSKLKLIRGSLQSSLIGMIVI